jgi:glutathione S-transferase
VKESRQAAAQSEGNVGSPAEDHTMTTRFKLCSFTTCPWVQRAAIVLRAKGIEYEIEYIEREKDKRPDWFRAISPHLKVPVLIIDGKDSLFESNAIAEYLDEVAEPRLHPADPIARARNRAWTDYLPEFASAVSRCAYSNTKAELEERAREIPEVFETLEGALQKRGNDGPFFNGADFSLVDAGYAPFLQRYAFTDRMYPLGIIEKYPLLKAWSDALLAHPAVRKSTIAAIEQDWRDNLVRHDRWLSTLLDGAPAAAAE